MYAKCLMCISEKNNVKTKTTNKTIINNYVVDNLIHTGVGSSSDWWNICASIQLAMLPTDFVESLPA